MLKPQVFILHFAGGNIYSFPSLTAQLKTFSTVEVLELPGRGRRMGEPLLNAEQDAVSDLLKQLRSKRNGAPYLLYGHSMGAVLGFRVVKAQETAGDPPVYFVASGNPGPNIRKRKQLATLPREEFFSELKTLGGITEEISANDELLDFFEPVLRADFALLEKGENDQPVSDKINTAIYAVMGNQEKNVGDIQNWRNYTRGSFDYDILEGNHFFIFDHTDTLARLIRQCFYKAY